MSEGREQREQIIRTMQKELVGNRYVGCAFSRLEGPKDLLQRLSDWLKHPKDICLIMGSPGCGKTFICSAVIDWVFGRVQSIRYWNERQIFERVRSYISSDVKGDYIREISDIADDYFLIIDDMGSAGFNDWRREVWLEIIDSRYSDQKPTLITTNLTSRQIKDQMGERSWSRLMNKENTFIDMHGFEDARQKEKNAKN